MSNEIKLYKDSPLNSIKKLPSSQLEEFEEFMFEELFIQPLQPRAFIIEKIKDKYKVSNRTAYKWYDIAISHFASLRSDSLKERYEQAIFNLEKLYNEAIKENDKQLALAVQKELNKINGLYIQQFDINITTTPPIFNLDGDILNIDDINKNKED